MLLRMHAFTIVEQCVSCLAPVGAFMFAEHHAALRNLASLHKPMIVGNIVTQFSLQQPTVIGVSTAIICALYFDLQFVQQCRKAIYFTIFSENIHA